jgi:flavin-dependent dehydrogenase
MPEDEVFRTPTKHLLEYIHKTVGTDHYSPARGHSARTIANRLARAVEDQGEGYVLLGKTVSGLRYEGEEVVVSFKGRNEEEGEAGEEQEVNVDRVILATPASVALSLLGMLEESLTPRASNTSSGAESEEEKEMQRVKTMRSALKKVRYKVSISPSISLHPI